MATTQLTITKQNEDNLKKIIIIGKINDIDVSNKEKAINLAIKIASECTIGLDEDSLINITGLKKSF